jgi:methyl-accepting chemotaxis protein
MRVEEFREIRARDSIRLRVILATFVLSVGGLVFAGMALTGAWKDREEALAQMRTSAALATLSRATISLSLERSVSQVSLEMPEAINAGNRAMIDDQRRKSETSFNLLRDELAAVTTSDRLAAFSQNIRAIHDRLQPIRQGFDAELGKPKSARSAEAVFALPFNLKSAVVEFQAERHLLRGTKLTLPTEVAILEMIRDQAWQIREFGGRERTYLAIAVANREPISPARLSEMGVLARRVDDSWRDISRLETHPGLHGGVTAAVQALSANYFTSYAALRSALLAQASTVRPDYPTDFKNFFAQSTAALDGAESLAGAASAAIHDYWLQRAQNTQIALIRDLLFGILLLATGSVTLVLMISAFRRMDKLRERMRSLAAGELSEGVPHVDARDELGAMARAVQVFRTTAGERSALEAERVKESQEKDRRQAVIDQLLKDFTKSLGVIIDGLSRAAARMDATSSTMASAANQTGDLAHTTTDRAKSSAQELTIVATATEELTSSVGEISRAATTAAQSARGMADRATSAEQAMAGLSGAAKEIDDIARLIGDIASQTNLLALNATIESARAGEAGKGFAVVASEVKNLASRTASATDEIVLRIDAIQAATQEAVSTVRQMAAAVRDMEETAASIAAAVEQQGVGVREIAGSITAVTQATEQAVASMDQAALAAENAREASQEVSYAAADIGKQSSTLKQEVDQFLSAIRRDSHEQAEAA